ncbi:hypothetical protein C8J55DRAFT_492923 [Lentinula edodes]|uniref:Uncharacterized protein n=1 Tax=Lentinula lateritia TaxID=40482 RepID=A0A9W8ZU09_9AGAR|nr:hypothetical protein C8J55DRAFT_492923 [Lentinula edodes]
MNAASQQGQTYAKTNLHMNQATDIYNPLPSPASSDFTPPLTQSTSGSNNSRSNFGSICQSPPQPSTPPLRYTHAHPNNQTAATHRPRTRYPVDLARAGDGRTPLHRRGTSQKYEPFEDLLREAGYKETRIFTPETERTVSGADDGDGSSGGKNKIAGVVEFLSGFIPGSRTSSLRDDSNETRKNHYSPPSSPSPISTRRQNQRADPEPGREHQKRPIDNDATPRATRTRTSRSVQSLQSTTPSPAIRYTHNNHSYTSIGQSSSSKPMPPSRATAYLRHIASVPDMPGADLQRSHSNSTRRRRSNRRSGTNDSRHTDDGEDDDFDSVYEGRTRGNGEGEEDPNVPPLPKGWLETVARAVLFGPGASLASRATFGPSETTAGSRAVSQPYANSQPSSSYVRDVSPALRQLRQTRSVISRTGSLADATTTHIRHPHQHHNLIRTQSARSALSSRSGLSDRTNRNGYWATMMPSPLSNIKSASADVYGANRPRPTLMTRLHSSSRSNASEGEIRRARVVCRSAPASRATSPNPNYLNPSSTTRQVQRKQSTQGRNKGNRSKSKSRSGKAGDEPPSLTRTMVELEGDGAGHMDSWLYSLPHPHTHQQGPNYSSNLRSEPSSESRYLSGWGWDSAQSSALPTSQPDYDSDGIGHFQNPPFSLSISVTNISDEADQPVSEGEESSENEVDLAKMLRPKPQRQESSNSTKSVSSLRSVRSLRKFLVSGVENDHIPPLPSSNGGGSARDIIDITPPTSATGRWFLDSEGSYADGNDRYGTKSTRGKRGSLPSGWTGHDMEHAA